MSRRPVTFFKKSLRFLAAPASAPRSLASRQKFAKAGTCILAIGHLICSPLGRATASHSLASSRASHRLSDAASKKPDVSITVKGIRISSDTCIRTFFCCKFFGLTQNQISVREPKCTFAAFFGPKVQVQSSGHIGCRVTDAHDAKCCCQQIGP